MTWDERRRESEVTPRGSLGGGLWGKTGGSAGHIKFEMPVRHLSGDVEVAVRWGEVWARDTHLVVVRGKWDLKP